MQPDQPRATDVREFALALQQAIRADGGAGTASWRDAVERGLSAAYAAGDIVALCDVVQAIVSLMDGNGRLRDAVSEIDHAVALAGSEANVLGMLHSMKATLLAACGDGPGAWASVREAESALASADIPFAIAKCELNCGVARTTLLDVESDAGRMLDLHPPGDARAADALFLMSYLVPWRFAQGARVQEHPLLRTFRLQSTAANHEYRLTDARLFEAAEQMVVEPLSALDFGTPPRWHWLGHWRKAVLAFPSASARRAIGAGRTRHCRTCCGRGATRGTRTWIPATASRCCWWRCWSAWTTGATGCGRRPRRTC